MCPARPLEYGLAKGQTPLSITARFHGLMDKAPANYRRRFLFRAPYLLTARQRLAGDGMVAVQPSVSKRAARSNVIGAREYS